MLDIIDLVLRPLGWLIALGISITAVSMSVASGFALVRFTLDASWPVRLLAWLAAGPLFGLVLFLIWRALRFAGGYVGSSDYPFEHVIRLAF